MHGNIGLEDRQPRTLFWFEVPLPTVLVKPVVSPGHPLRCIVEGKQDDAGSGRASLQSIQHSLVVEDIGNDMQLPLSSESENAVPSTLTQSGVIKSSKRSLRVSTSKHVILTDAAADMSQVCQ